MLHSCIAINAISARRIENRWKRAHTNGGRLRGRGRKLRHDVVRKSRRRKGAFRRALF